MKAHFKDYYQLLGIEKSATPEEIKVAYRELALKVHPDHNPGKEAHKRFIELNEAYHILTDVNKRRKYDHVYLRHYATKKHQADYSSQLEMTRQKRASRYKRGRYTPRVRYHGTAATQGDYFDKDRKKQRRKPYNEVNDAYVREVEAAYESEMAGLRMYGTFTRFIALLLLVFGIGMLLESLVALPAGPEKIISQTFTPRSPLTIRIKTPESRFSVHRKYGYLLNEGTEITISKSLFKHKPIKIWVDKEEKAFELEAIRRNNGALVFWMFVIICTSIGTLFTRKYPHTGATLGSFSLVQALWVLGDFFLA